MQLIYKGETTLSLPKVKFAEGFLSSVSEIHCSNEKESFKLLEELSCLITKEREKVLVYQ